MQRINTDDGRYHAGNPSTGTKGTIVTSDAMNALQEEMAGFIEAAGIALKPDDNGQLLKALYALLKKAGSVNAYSIASLPKDRVYSEARARARAILPNQPAVRPRRVVGAVPRN